MKIDIIDLTDPKYNSLNAVQLSMVRTAQSQKDDAVEEAEKEKGELFRMMLANNTVRSSARLAEEAGIDARVEKKVESIRENLLYQLAYEGMQWDGNEQGPYRYPENPNYSLSYSQRFLVVRSYYMSVTEDPQARLQAFAMDTLAQTYLGEFYITLFELLASYC